MKISIITPSYNRPDNLIRAISSVLFQDFENWEMIIVNDSPEYNYKGVEEFIKNKNDKRIRYFKNDQNRGVNYSRNRAIDQISTDSDYTFFLDDDDQLTKDSLSKQIEIIQRTRTNWLLTLSESNAKEVGIDSIKTTKQDKRYYSYLWDYLIRRKMRGDYAQMLKTSIIKNNSIYYSKKVRQAEEWVFSIRYSRHAKCYLENTVTLTKEYEPQGMSKNVLKTKFLNLKNAFILSNEIFWEGFYPLEKLYILIKVVRNIQKLIF